MKHKDHMMKYTLMAPKWTWEWGQQQSSTTISRMVRQPATKTARQQHHLCSWTHSHQSSAEPLPTHGPSPSRRSCLLWLSVCLQAIEGGDTENPFICHIMNLRWLLSEKGTYVRFLLDTKPLRHWRKWKSRPTIKRDPWPRYRPTDKSSLYIYEATAQFLHSEIDSNQVRYSCTWQRSLSWNQH